VQGDIMNPPFVEGAFASAYSIGVLHHTPDTRTAFRSIVDLVRPGGRISIWVYRTFQPEIEVREYKRMFATFQELASDGTRIVTTRLPHQLLHWLCHAAVPLGWVKMKVDDGKIPKVLGWPFLLLPISSHREWRVRICDTFDWLSPRYQWKHTSAEVFGWFEAADLQSIQKQELSVSVTGVRPVRREGEDPLDVANALEAEAMAG
jgi:SAM-dependent methyltransferase